MPICTQVNDGTNICCAHISVQTCTDVYHAHPHKKHKYTLKYTIKTMQGLGLRHLHICLATSLGAPGGGDIRMVKRCTAPGLALRVSTSAMCVCVCVFVFVCENEHGMLCDMHVMHRATNPSKHHIMRTINDGVKRDGGLAVVLAEEFVQTTTGSVGRLPNVV